MLQGLYTSKIQKCTRNTIFNFLSFDNSENKRGIFLVDLGSLPTLDPNIKMDWLMQLVKILKN